MSDRCVVCGKPKGSVYAGRKCLGCHMSGRGTPEDSFAAPSYADHLTAWKATQQWNDASEREETFVNGNLNAFAGYLDRSVPLRAPATDADWLEYERLKENWRERFIAAYEAVGSDAASAVEEEAEAALDAHVRRMSGRAE